MRETRCCLIFGLSLLGNPHAGLAITATSQKFHLLKHDLHIVSSTQNGFAYMVDRTYVKDGPVVAR